MSYIVTVRMNHYIDTFPLGKKDHNAWNQHFVEKDTHLLVREEPSNNGNAKAYDFKNRLIWIEANDIIAVKEVKK